jgi:hypothetical protein
MNKTDKIFVTGIAEWLEAQCKKITQDGYENIVVRSHKELT